MQSSSKYNLPIISILIVYTIWGVQPLYWQFFSKIPLTYILAHRIVWSVFLLIPITVFTGKWKNLLSLFRSSREISVVALCSLMIGANWMINIYAAYSKQVVEASLGHYVTPILVIALGVYILKESIQMYKIIASLIASFGVVLLTIGVGKIPFIAILLILTFTTYTFLKKTVKIDPIIGISAETILLLPISLAYLFYNQYLGTPFFVTATNENILLLMSTGVFTSIPLLLFAYGVKYINLSNLGFIQYYAPTVSLMIGVFIFRETFTNMHLLSFSLIWIAIIIVLITPIIWKNQLKN